MEKAILVRGWAVMGFVVGHLFLNADRLKRGGPSNIQASYGTGRSRAGYRWADVCFLRSVCVLISQGWQETP